MTGFLPRYFLLTTSAVINGISPAYASWLLGMMNGLSILGRVGIGMFADRFGKIQALTASFIFCGTYTDGQQGDLEPSGCHVESHQDRVDVFAVFFVV